jgi:WD40 repeat protein
MLVRKTRYQKLSRVAFAPDGRGLAAAGAQGVFWWRSVFDEEKAERRGDNECNGVGYTPDGKYLWAIISRGGGKCELVALALADGSRRSVSVEGNWVSVTVCPTTGLAVIESWAGGELSGWRVGADGAPARAWSVEGGHGSIGSTVAFAPGGKWFVRALKRQPPWSEYDLIRHDPVTGKAIRSLPAGEWVSAGPAVSPDGKWIAFGYVNMLRVQPAGNPKHYELITNDNTHQFTGLAFHPNGAFLAVTNNDATVKLYDTATWKLARTFTWDIGKMRSVCFSPDGTLAAAGSDKGKVVVWDVDA